jgi:spore germination protein YaaH
VPAGTYQVFRIDTSTSNVTTTFTHQSKTSFMNTITSTKGQTYIEYGTGRQILFTTESIVYREGMRNYTRSVNTTLVQHIKP